MPSNFYPNRSKFKKLDFLMSIPFLFSYGNHTVELPKPPLELEWKS